MLEVLNENEEDRVGEGKEKKKQSSYEQWNVLAFQVVDISIIKPDLPHRIIRVYQFS